MKWIKYDEHYSNTLEHLHINQEISVTIWINHPVCLFDKKTPEKRKSEDSDIRRQFRRQKVKSEKVLMKTIS